MSEYGDFIDRCIREGADIPLGNPFSSHCAMCGEPLGERRLCPKDPAKRECSNCVEVLAREKLTFDPALCEGKCVNCGLPLLIDRAYAFACPKIPHGWCWCFSKEARDAAIAGLAARRGDEEGSNASVPNSTDETGRKMGSHAMASVETTLSTSTVGRSPDGVSARGTSEKACALGFAGCLEDHSAEDDVNVHRQVTHE